LAIVDTVIASAGVTHRNTFEEFEAIVGKAEAEAALGGLNLGFPGETVGAFSFRGT
jgi:hypothetical protein